jgi:AcrR family transcriptional regulator
VPACVWRDSVCLTDSTTGDARGQDESRARIVSAARKAFAEAGYEAGVHQICRAAGVGIGTFYHQFLNKAEVMRLLFEEEHAYRVSAFDALGADQGDDTGKEVVRVISGSDPALMRAMIEACEFEPRLRSMGDDLRRESRSRLAMAFDRLREARGIRRPALDSTTAAAGTLALGYTALGRVGGQEVERIVNLLAFAESSSRGARV